jgi:hypothetical protein
VLLLRRLGPGGPREWRSPCSALTGLGMLICRCEGFLVARLCTVWRVHSQNTMLLFDSAGIHYRMRQKLVSVGEDYALGTVPGSPGRRDGRTERVGLASALIYMGTGGPDHGSDLWYV